MLIIILRQLKLNRTESTRESFRRRTSLTNIDSICLKTTEKKEEEEEEVKRNQTSFKLVHRVIQSSSLFTHSVRYPEDELMIECIHLERSDNRTHINSCFHVKKNRRNQRHH
jgi:hypothetical protein